MTLFSKKEDTEDFYFTYPQAEDPDWNYARNRFFALKKTGACWSSSLFSVDLQGALLPNRDYPHQGLLCKVGEDYRKFLDGLATKLMKDDDKVELEPTKIRLSPWEVIYHYRGDGVSLKIAYYLAFGEKDKAGGRVTFELESEEKGRFELVMMPLVDMRNLAEDSPAPEEYSVNKNDGYMRIASPRGELLLDNHDSAEIRKEAVDWNYKLGDGERKMDDGKVYFKGVEKSPVIACDLHIEIERGEKRELGVACGRDLDGGDIKRALKKSKKDEVKRSKDILDKFSFEEDTLFGRFMKSRVLALDSFGTVEKDMEIPEAGEWWFRDVWFRDLFESLYHNLDFYRKTRGDDWLKRVFRWARIYVKDGIMANRVAENPNYNSQDATFLYLLTMSKFYEKAGDEEFRNYLEKAFNTIINRFGKIEDLVECKANYSWMDVKAGGKPARVPEEWDVGNEDFLLPEVNALWIKCLKRYNEICGGDIDVKKVFKKYRETFWNEEKGFPYQIVYRDGDRELKDPTASSAGMMAVSLLSEDLFGNDLLDVWKTVEEELLIRRRPAFFEKKDMPFGILARKSERRIFLDDGQYQEAVVWPRDLSYLFKILKRLGKEDVVEEMSKNILDHQMNEGAIFYNHELFSLPSGENPSSTLPFENPVPVKNPIQLWSHFLPGG